MKKTDLAYIAGIIDGEGCIFIGHGKVLKSGKRKCVLCLSVSSTDEWLCQFLKMAFGGSIGKYNKPKNPNYSDAWHWNIGARQALIVLKSILPYLNLKRPQAELAIKFQEAKFHYHKGLFMLDKEAAIEEAQYILMRNLKHKSSREVK